MENQVQENSSTSSLSGVEQKNRIVLILALVFLFCTFMDYQAKRHYKSINSQAINQTELESHDKNLETPPNQQSREWEGIETQTAEHIISQKKEDLNPGEMAEQDQSTLPGQAIIAQTRNILSKFTHIKKGLEVAIKEQTAVELAQIRAKPQKAIALLAKGPQKEILANEKASSRDAIQYQGQHYFLYFIRFDGKKSNLIRVSRPHKGEYLHLSKVLEELRKGPRKQEKNLLNNFNHYIKINSVSLVGKAAFVDLNSAIGRLGEHVIQDRLEQLAHTLTQFDQVDYVKVLVEGRALSHIGAVKMMLPPILKPRRPSSALLL